MHRHDTWIETILCNLRYIALMLLHHTPLIPYLWRDEFLAELMEEFDMEREEEREFFYTVAAYFEIEVKPSHTWNRVRDEIHTIL